MLELGTFSKERGDMKKSKVLIVDDHPATRFGISQLIETTEDLEVAFQAGCREEVLEGLKNIIPELAILDISLQPDSPTGLDLIKDIHYLVGPIPVLILSMHDEIFYAERALQCGARGYLTKQEPVREILKALQVIRDGAIYLSPTLRDSLFNNSSASRIKDLSSREFEIFQQLGKGYSAQEIAEIYNLSIKTVESHKFHIKKKLGFKSMTEVVRFSLDFVKEK